MKPSHIKSLITTTIFLLSVLFYAQASNCTASVSGKIPKGTAGAYIGKLGNDIIIAGGSDFPDKKPWEGGIKEYSSDIYILSLRNGKYICSKAGINLPVPLGSGACVSDGTSLYCIGGKNSKRASSAIYRIRNSGSILQIDSVAAIPSGFIPSSAAILKNDIYIHGTDGVQNLLFKFSPSSGKWVQLNGCPDRPIIEGASFIYQHNGKEDAIYLIGGRGTDKNGLYLSSSVWEYTPAHNSWLKRSEIATNGDTTSLMYSSAIRYGSAHIIVAGGDDGIEFKKRIELSNSIEACKEPAVKEKLNAELILANTGHKSFSNKILAYHTITDTWIELGKSETPLPVVTTAIDLNGKIIIPSGEIHPGVRSTDIIEIKISDSVSFGWLNYTVIIIYMLGMVGVGVYFSRKTKNTEQFFKGGSKIPWWAAGISIFATALSAITFLSIPAKAYMDDWSMFMFNMAILMIVPIVIHFYIPFFRKLNVASAYQYLEDRFSPSVRYLASLFFCLFMFARVAIVLFLPSLALNAVTGLDIYLCIVLMGIVTIIYCTMGGIEAVVWGDVIQGIILVGGAVISLVYIISGVEGGAGAIINTAIAEEKFNILDFSFDWARPVFWVTLLGGIANQLLTYTSDQSVVQRYVTVKDTKGTNKGLWLNGLLSIPIAILFFSIGTGLYAFFKSHPDMLNVGMSNTDSIFPHFIMCDLPSGIAGLLIAAIFAAAMSTLSSNINSTSTVMTEDFYSKLNRNASDGSKMKFAKWTGVILGVFGIVMAIALATFDITSLWDQFNFFLGLLTSGVGGLFMMGIFTKRIGTRSAVTGFAGSIVVLLLCNGYSHISVILYGFIGLVSCFIIGYLSSFIYGYNK